MLNGDLAALFPGQPAPADSSAGVFLSPRAGRARCGLAADAPLNSSHNRLKNGQFPHICKNPP